MATYTYIKFDIKGYFIDFGEKFNKDLYNNLGETYQDFLDNKWVCLSDEQKAFHEANPKASVSEVWNMELTPTPQRTLDDAKAEMKNKIRQYDSSESVNSFTINENGSYWFTPTERSNYKTSIDSAELLKVETLSLYVGDMPLTLPTETAKGMLAQIQLYADACYNVTKAHESAVDALETIEDVDAFEFMEGYPKKVNFDIPMA